MLRQWVRRTACLGCVLLVGCSGGDKPAPVKGTVTFEGKPVANATVTFTPAGEGKLSVGTTTADGSYELYQAGPERLPGAKVGSHSVSISAIEQKITGNKSAQQENLGSLEMVDAKTKTRYLVPPKYASSRTSGLTFEVKAGEENVADFKLE